jgi:hypothetical protein
MVGRAARSLTLRAKALTRGVKVVADFVVPGQRRGVRHQCGSDPASLFPMLRTRDQEKIMSYVNATLQTGERVTAAASRHWIIYARPLFWAGIGLLLSAIADPVGVVVLLIALLSLIGSVFDNWTTELAVTDRRVIYKSGFIRRRTFEMNMGKIESVVVKQSLLGRLLDFGTIRVKGTGQSVENFKSIRRPLAVRESIAAS